MTVSRFCINLAMIKVVTIQVSIAAKLYFQKEISMVFCTNEISGKCYSIKKLWWHDLYI